jgi:hypothetical protein
MTASIKKLYTSKGLRPPDGKSIHTYAFHAMATELMKKGFGKPNAYAIAMSKLGRNKAVKASHWAKGKEAALKKVFKT